VQELVDEREKAVVGTLRPHLEDRTLKVTLEEMYGVDAPKRIQEMAAQAVYMGDAAGGAEAGGVRVVDDVISKRWEQFNAPVTRGRFRGCVLCACVHFFDEDVALQCSSIEV
jgi:hypothetical protein